MLLLFNYHFLHFLFELYIWSFSSMSTHHMLLCPAVCVRVCLFVRLCVCCREAAWHVARIPYHRVVLLEIQRRYVRTYVQTSCQSLHLTPLCPYFCFELLCFALLSLIVGFMFDSLHTPSALFNLFLLLILLIPFSHPSYTNVGHLILIL